MTMICAKEFAEWLRHRFSSEDKGVYLTREDVNHLTGRQRLDPGFVNDVHYELSCNMGWLSLRIRVERISI